jgi:cytoskeletal protein RodZ
METTQEVSEALPESLAAPAAPVTEDTPVVASKSSKPARKQPAVSTEVLPAGGATPEAAAPDSGEEFRHQVRLAFLRVAPAQDAEWAKMAGHRMPHLVSAMEQFSKGDLSLSLRNQYAIAALESMIPNQRINYEIMAKRAYTVADLVING